MLHCWNKESLLGKPIWLNGRFPTCHPVHVPVSGTKSLVLVSGGEDCGFEGSLVLRPAVHRQQRLRDVAQTQQEGEKTLPGTEIRPGFLPHGTDGGKIKAATPSDSSFF